MHSIKREKSQEAFEMHTKKEGFASQSNYWFLCPKIKLTPDRNLKW